MNDILIIKTGALGDVLRTTSILEGLHKAYPGAQVTWLTAPAAEDLVQHHPRVHRTLTVQPKDSRAVEALGQELGRTHWHWVLSFDDEEPLCRLAAGLRTTRLTGATMEGDERTYTQDVRAWFDMGLLSHLGKEVADQMKVDNGRTHPEIFASMLGIQAGKPLLLLPAASRSFAAAFFAKHELDQGGTTIGFNTGAGGRWHSKTLPIDRCVELALGLNRALDGEAHFLVFGGPNESDRNRELAQALSNAEGGLHAVDAGTDNSILDFAALVAGVDLLVTSDSLAMHLAIANDTRLVAFFAPTSAAEIELYGLGEKVWSSAPDYCSYRPDADNSTITPARIQSAALRVLGS